MAQLLLMRNCTADERDEYARIILNSGRTLLALLNDVLDLAKVEAGKFVLDRTVFSPEQVVSETTKLFAETANTKGLSLNGRWHGPATMRLLGDPLRVRQMLSNLIINAVKFTPTGTVSVDAAIDSETGDEVVLRFTVTDTGIGVPPEKHALLFQPFSQMDASTTRRFGGSGLGLSIVNNFARLMNGEVGCESTPGNGSKFWFRIRTHRVALDSDSRASARAPAATAELREVARFCSKRVLIAEDNPVNLKVAESILRRCGIVSLRAVDGREAVAAATASPRPDLVLMDCHMPEMDGFTATRQIRAFETANKLPRLPIIALTASVFEQDRQLCAEAGMDAFLPKPVEFAALVAMLEKWLAPDSAPKQ